MLELLPRQGEWHEQRYLALETNRLVELVDDCLEFPPMPTFNHQQLVGLLWLLLRTYAFSKRGARAVMAPFKLRIDGRNYREPDVLFLKPEHAGLHQDAFWTFADFLIEVVSPDEPNRDYIDKRADYARLGVPEYWIVDPEKGQLLQLILKDGAYVDHAVHALDKTVRAVTLDGFEVDFAKLMAEAAE
jgi:Uma2 family endonuclease